MHYFLIVILLVQGSLMAAVDVPLENLPKELGDEPEADYGPRSKLRRFYHKTWYGTKNPHAPFSVQYWPIEFRLPKHHHIPSDLLINKRHIRLDTLSHQDIERLSDEELYYLLAPLAQEKVSVKWKDRFGNIKSGKNRKHQKRTLGLAKTDQTNAAAALALSMGSQGYTFEFCRMLSLVPEAIIPELRGHGIAMLSAKSLALSLLTMVDYIEKKDISSVAKSSAALTGLYLKYYSRKNNRRLEKYLHKVLTEVYLLLESAKESNRSDGDVFSRAPYNEMQIGIIFGSILSAAIIHAENIAESDAKRVFLVNTGSNLIWASTSFLGAAPMGSAAATAVVGGVISMAAVGGAAAYCKWGMHESSVPNTRELEGRIQAAILQSCNDASNETKSKIFTMLHWMNTTIHLNGLGD